MFECNNFYKWAWGLGLMARKDYYFAVVGRSANVRVASEVFGWLKTAENVTCYDMRKCGESGLAIFDYNLREAPDKFVEVFGGGSRALWDSLRGWSRTHSAGDGRAGMCPIVLKFGIFADMLHSPDIVDTVRREWPGYEAVFIQEERAG